MSKITTELQGAVYSLSWALGYTLRHWLALLTVSAMQTWPHSLISVTYLLIINTCRGQISANKYIFPRYISYLPSSVTKCCHCAHDILSLSWQKRLHVAGMSGARARVEQVVEDDEKVYKHMHV